MRFSLFALAATVAVVAAQDLSSIPTCAIPCFVAATPSSGCGLTDTKCQCTTGRDAITNSLNSCVPSKCSASDIAAIAPAVAKLCASAGVTITDLPSGTPVPSAAGNSTASRTSTMSGSASRTSAPAQSTNGAAANGLSLGALAVGLAAFAL